MTDLAEAFQAIGDVCADLDRTLLLGWPHDTYPTDAEAQAIELTHDELMLQEPGLGDERCWYLAGQIAARIRRDRSPSGE